MRRFDDLPDTLDKFNEEVLKDERQRYYEAQVYINGVKDNSEYEKLKKLEITLTLSQDQFNKLYKANKSLYKSKIKIIYQQNGPNGDYIVLNEVVYTREKDADDIARDIARENEEKNRDMMQQEEKKTKAVLLDEKMNDFFQENSITKEDTKNIFKETFLLLNIYKSANMNEDRTNVTVFLAYCSLGKIVPVAKLNSSPFKFALNSPFEAALNSKETLDAKSLLESFNCLTPEDIKLFYEFFEEYVTFDKIDGISTITEKTFYSNFINIQTKLILLEPAPARETASVQAPEPAPEPVSVQAPVQKKSYFSWLF